MSQTLMRMMMTWEINHPVLSAHEVVGDLAALVTTLQKQGILLPTTPAAAFTCTECGERQRLIYITGQKDTTHAYINCRDCGPSKIDDSLLLRWQIDSRKFIGAIFQSLDLSVREHLPRQLWHLGRANLAGRSRDVWFVRNYQPSLVDAVVTTLKTRPKSILFAPLESSVLRWQAKLPNLVFALESSFGSDGISLDIEAIESRIAELEPNTKVSKTTDKVSARRALRLSHIELLRNELIKHLRSARDHAYAQKELTGKSKLLKRPSKKKLGELVGLRSDTVTRCFQDHSAKELGLLWKLAVDLPRLIKWTGSISKVRT
ncbi:hypothetical protein NA78x_002734 [Anatilimnocola sp. NA78]|uniref:hypothetical protein n=1 Tax=Anatilimnocola sp. NA78 TaxID=3415683 RepID=UPI003CE4A57B